MPETCRPKSILSEYLVPMHAMSCLFNIILIWICGIFESIFGKKHELTIFEEESFVGFIIENTSVKNITKIVRVLKA